MCAVRGLATPPPPSNFRPLKDFGGFRPHVIGNLPNGRKEGRKEMFYITTHSTHFIYGYMASVLPNEFSKSSLITIKNNVIYVR